MIEVLPFCDNWPNYRVRTEDERREYVAEEMRRVQQAHGPLLRVVLACSVDHAQRIALKYLSGEMLTPSGEQPITPQVIYLRLRDGAQPPHRDPQGRAIPAPLAGKILRAKVGNVVYDEGRKRKVADQQGRDLYVLRDVSAEPKPFALAEALVILRQWGYGVSPETSRQLVEEVDPLALAAHPTPTQKQRAAA